jgi:hypothetical protein
MPKKDVDYSNTIIYKICCKDDTIKDLYIGHTTNFIQRKYLHKHSCNNLDNTLKIYNVIRCNEGWENWDMVEIAKYSCKDSTEARIKEQEHYDQLKASLNSRPPYVDKNKYFCNICNLQCESPKQYETHMNSIKHINTINLEQQIPKLPKIPKTFCCKNCDYITSSCKDYNKHLLTRKHQKTIEPEDCTDMKTFYCQCGNEYKYRQNLYTHRKSCAVLTKQCTASKNVDTKTKLQECTKEETTEILNPTEPLSTVPTEMLLKLIQQNAELIAKVQQPAPQTIINNYNTTNRNSTFNLNVYLNETCKDALSIDEFLDTIHVKLMDLENSRMLGYSEGLSKIIINRLNEIDAHKRPIHCSDLKRETMYIKAGENWEKENEEKTNIKRAIKIVEHKTIRCIPEWIKTHPNCIKSTHRDSTPYLHMVKQVTGGDLEKEEKNINNIIKKIAENVVIKH